MPPELEFGVFQMPEYRPVLNWTLALDNMVQQAAHVEQLGFSEYWVGEHHSAGHETVPIPDMMLARIAEATDTIRLGPATINLPYEIHDPFFVAERMAFLDQLSHGRVNLGYGAGALPRDMELFDVDTDTQKAKMWEAVDVIETYLEAEEPTDFTGEFYQYEDRLVQLPFLQENPPSAVAGLSSYSTHVNAVKGGHRPMSIAFTPLSAPDNPAAVSLKDQAAAIDEGAKAIGRDPAAAHDEWAIGREVFVAESKEAAYNEIREGVEEYYDYLFGLGDGGLVNLVVTDENMTRDDVTVEWMIENYPFIIGSPEDCVKQIKQLYHEVDGFGTLIINAHDWMLPESRWRDMYELFAEEVMPAFQPRKGPREIEKQQVPNYTPWEPDGPSEFGL